MVGAAGTRPAMPCTYNTQVPLQESISQRPCKEGDLQTGWFPASAIHKIPRGPIIAQPLMAQSFPQSVRTRSHLHSVQEIVWMMRKTTGGTFWDLYWPECLSCVCNLPYLSMPGRIRKSGMRWSSASSWNVMHWIWVRRNLQFCCNILQACQGALHQRSSRRCISPGLYSNFSHWFEVQRDET